MNKKQRAAARRKKNQIARRNLNNKSSSEEVDAATEKNIAAKQIEPLAEDVSKNEVAQGKPSNEDPEPKNKRSSKEEEDVNDCNQNEACTEEVCDEIIIELAPQLPKIIQPEGTVPKCAGRFLNPLVFPKYDQEEFKEYTW